MRFKHDPIYWTALRRAVEQGLADADAGRLVAVEDLLDQYRSGEQVETVLDIEAGLADSIAGRVTDNADVRSEFGLGCGVAVETSMIKSDAEYRRVLWEAESLMSAGPDSPEGERLDVLADQVAAYEIERFRLDEADDSPQRD